MNHDATWSPSRTKLSPQVFPSSSWSRGGMPRHQETPNSGWDDMMSVPSRSSSDDFLQQPPKTKEYMDSLVPPSAVDFERIASVQVEREDEHRRKAQEQRRQQSLHATKSEHDDGVGSVLPPEHTPDERFEAARIIQKTFRGYRTRREMQGFGLDASTRWVAAIKEAQFRSATQPRPRSDTDGEGAPLGSAHVSRTSTAKSKWKMASVVARRANHDDTASSESESDTSSDEQASPEDRAAARSRREQRAAARRSEARMMGIRYFLEMVDVKHRYGSSLCQYHEEWKRSSTRENFFYWLDYGEGKGVELEGCPRDRLDRERVRYLSREERQYYLVQVDAEGRLCWAKNGERIDTSERFKDSIHGVVPSSDPTPPFNAELQPTRAPRDSDVSSISDGSLEAKRQADRAAKYVEPPQQQQGEKETGLVKKLTHVSPTTAIFNKLLRKSVKKNTWIFVADTSFRMYVGIKNSGAFQHSSFLQGRRISAAGLIKAKNGRLRSLSPLSGHYRPPAANFRAFVRNLKEEGVDLSHVSISKSYAVLVGLEAYMATTRKGKEAVEKVLHRRDRILDPEEFARREEEARDKSKSAALERRALEREEREREAGGARMRVMQKLRIVSSRGGGEGGMEKQS